MRTHAHIRRRGAAGLALAFLLAAAGMARAGC